MIKKSKLLILFTLLIPLSIFSQVGGEAVYQFLNMSTSARQIALGGEALTILDNVNQPIWNPAAINANIDNQFSANYTSYFAGIQVGSASYAYLISRRFGTIHTAVQYLNYGELTEAQEDGTITGVFKAYDLAFSIGYAFPLGNTDIYMGTNIKMINESIASFSSIGIATDIALMYHRENKPFSFVVVARNLGAQLKTFDGTREKLPLNILFGSSLQLKHVPIKWHLTIDHLEKWNLSNSNPSNANANIAGGITPEKISFLNNALRHVAIGAELFPKGVINLRVGYNFRRAKELKLNNAKTFPGLSFGFGLQMNRLKLNYAYTKLYPSAPVNSFSLRIQLGKI